jgi:hypothetical protein
LISFWRLMVMGLAVMDMIGTELRVILVGLAPLWAGGSGVVGSGVEAGVGCGLRQVFSWRIRILRGRMRIMG